MVTQFTPALKLSSSWSAHVFSITDSAAAACVTSGPVFEAVFVASRMCTQDDPPRRLFTIRALFYNVA